MCIYFPEYLASGCICKTCFNSQNSMWGYGYAIGVLLCVHHLTSTFM